MTTQYTPYLRLAKPPFDDIPWDEAVNGNMDTIDAFTAQYMNVPNYVGGWNNSTNYIVGQQALDISLSSLYTCAITHVSAAAPTTFLQERSANPTMWTLTGSAPPVFPATTLPVMDGMAAIGGQTAYSRGDHVHPSDTSRLPLAGGTLTGPLILAADPVNPLGTATKQYVDAAASASAAHNVGRNLLHNSLFNVQQRGAGPWVASANYTADRWQLSITLDNVSASLTTLNDTTRGQIGDEAATTCWQAIVTGNGGASAFSLLGQPIENVRRLAGKTITVSFWAAASGALKLGVNVLQNFGSGGASSVWATPQTVTLSTIWTRYSATIVIPSAALKTFGTAGTDFSQVSFVFSSGTTNAAVLGNPGVQSGTFQLWGVQLEIGSVATPLEKPDPQQDLAKCQRFFCSVTGGLYVASAGSASQQAFIPVGQAMRAMPTVAGYTSLGATSFPASGSYGVVGGPSGLAIADNRSATTNLAAFFYGTYFLSADL